MEVVSGASLYAKTACDVVMKMMLVIIIMALACIRCLSRDGVATLSDQLRVTIQDALPLVSQYS